ncbi:MAG: gliding motility-associated ABC transporter substrate-binding protein GldG [Bacteroidetes bacterium]|nr:MAG: gliding motility-associated ABC transporter substrate-binding protein GldG [Bacteroidota bacterium]
MKKKNSKKTQSLINLALLIGIAIFLNILGNLFYTYLDMTEEKRFTLTEPTRQLLRNLDDVVYVEVLLDGKFPAGFKRLQKAVSEILDDFRSESGYIDYEFFNPNDGTVEEINQMREKLRNEGIVPTSLEVRNVDGSSEQLIYPWAKVHYKGRTAIVDLLEEGPGLGIEAQERHLNNSISLLEYKFANAIQKLLTGHREVIAFTKGHGELSDLEKQDLVNTLRAYYDVGVFNLDSATFIPQDVKVLVVAKPRLPFKERDKFLIDQYVMNGGKVVWLIDPLNVGLDSMRLSGYYVPHDYPLDLDDILFRYGVRINPNMVLDLQCTPIPIQVDPTGTIDLKEWYYHPIAFPDSKHPVVKSLDGINLDFPASIDTVRTKTPVQKTILLHSSDHSRIQPNITRLSFDILRYPPEPEKFNKARLPFAVMLEGTFPSLYENRVTQNMLEGLKELNMEFKTVSKPTKMLVVSDGDIAKNIVTDPQNRKVMPLGYNRFARYQFDNKEFLVNAIEYLRDQNGIIEARSKEVKLRLLDTVRAEAEKTKWQLINIVVPLIFLGLFGFAYNWWRRRKYAQ